MKSRIVVALTSAALVGAMAPGFAQAARGDGYRDGGYRGGHGGYSQHYRGHDRHDNSALGLALGLGILGIAIASQYNANAVPNPYNPPVYQQPAYGHSYGPNYGPNYGSGYYQPAPYGYTQ